MIYRYQFSKSISADLPLSLTLIFYRLLNTVLRTLIFMIIILIIIIHRLITHALLEYMTKSEAKTLISYYPK